MASPEEKITKYTHHPVEGICSDFKINTFNIDKNSIENVLKLENISQDIIFLQESQKEEEKQGEYFYKCKQEGTRCNGVLVKESIFEVVPAENEYKYEHRWCKIILQHRTTEQKIVAISWHGPYKVSLEIKKEAFYELLKFAKQMFETHKAPIIIGGDFNLDKSKAIEFLEAKPELNFTIKALSETPPPISVEIKVQSSPKTSAKYSPQASAQSSHQASAQSSPQASAQSSHQASAQSSPQPSAQSSPQTSSTGSPQPPAQSSPQTSSTGSPQPPDQSSPQPPAQSSPQASSTGSPQASAKGSPKSKGRQKENIDYFICSSDFEILEIHKIDIVMQDLTNKFRDISVDKS